MVDETLDADSLYFINNLIVDNDEEDQLVNANQIGKDLL